MPLKRFKYKAIKLPEPQSIRILTLQPSEDPNSALTVSLRTVRLLELTADDQYEALSWAWGMEADSETLTIKVGSKLMNHAIRPNLKSCLRRLRYPDVDRKIWIDAICINQKDPTEKNQQVAIMREIYRRAKGTIVWLGEASPQLPPLEADLKATFNFIQDRLLKRGLDEVTKDQDHIKHWENLQAIMMKPWFNRRWVIQEIALATEATVYCGQQVIPWKDFSYAVSLFVDAEPALHLSNRARSDKYYRADMFSEISRTGAAELTELQSGLFRSSIQGPRSLATLEFLVSRLPMFECGTAQDAIYALLAVARDTAPHSGNFWDAAPMDRYLQEFARYKMEHLLSEGADEALEKAQKQVFDRLERMAKSGRRVAMLLGEKFHQRSYPISYETAEVDVYVHFMKFVIKSSGSLDMICRPWAPRVWAKKPKPEKGSDSDSSSSSEEDDGQFQQQVVTPDDRPLRLPSWIQDRSKRAFCSAPTDDGRDLARIVRRNADSLVDLPGRSTYSASGGVKASMRTTSFRRRGEGDHSLYVKGFVIGSVAESEVQAVGGNVPRAWLTFAGWRDLTQDPPPELCRTLIANREPSRDHIGSTPPSYYDMVCKRILTPAFQKNAVNIDNRLTKTEDVLEQRYLRRMRAVITERVLFRMRGKKGLSNRSPLALGPKPSRSRHTPDTANFNDQRAASSRGVQEEDLVCILYGCSVPVILRRVDRNEQELERERDFWRRSFAQSFFRGIVRTQRIFKLKQAIKASRIEERARESSRQENKHRRASLISSKQNSQPSVDPRRIKEEAMRITKSIENDIMKRNELMKEKDEQAVNDFEQLSKSLVVLRKEKHAHGTNWLGRPLQSPLNTPRVQDPIHYEDCQGARPTGKPLKIPEMPADPNPARYYELIGECYVDGLMDGEALEARSSYAKQFAKEWLPPEDVSDAIFDEIFEIR